MQKELESERPDLDIQILAINEDGFGPPDHQDDVELATTAYDTPLLQDTADVDAWGSWNVSYRDVIVLDAENRKVGVFNLTNSSLADTLNYQALKDMLIAAAGG